eukprot:gene13411-19262_t
MPPMHKNNPLRSPANSSCSYNPSFNGARVAQGSPSVHHRSARSEVKPVSAVNITASYVARPSSPIHVASVRHVQHTPWTMHSSGIGNPQVACSPAVHGSKRGEPMSSRDRFAWYGYPSSISCHATSRMGPMHSVPGSLSEAPLEQEPKAPHGVLLLGGAGRIGTAAAIHLLKRSSVGSLHCVLAGRNASRGKAAVAEVQGEVGAELLKAGGHSVSFTLVDWEKPGSLKALLDRTKPTAVLHTAGPFDEDMDAGVLRECVTHGVSVYVDVADPIPYLDAAKKMSDLAAQSGTCAVVSAGAFPGFSNVLAVECARRLGAHTPIKDVRFSYFTAGLGGSGPINLLITNLGFGQPVPIYQGGKLSPQMVAGASIKRVKFYLDESDPAFELVGEREVWPWPFPEAATVSRHLKISGDSATGMGTAPGIWNTVLVGLVALVPRKLWLERWFSEGLAWFSLPMVALTDKFVSETHAIRVDVEAEDGRTCVAVQCHQSFRRCVAQSSAEFVLELLERKYGDDGAEGGLGGAGASWQPGVYLPEELADNEATGPRLLKRLSSTEGTVSCGFMVNDNFSPSDYDDTRLRGPNRSGPSEKLQSGSKTDTRVNVLPRREVTTVGAKRSL